MKPNTPNPSFLISKVYCSLFGHDFKVSKEITNHVKEYTCTHCHREATTNVRGRLEIMTPKMKEINATLTNVHTKKMAKKDGQRRQLQVAS